MTTVEETMSEDGPASSVPGPMTMVRGPALDVGLPVLAYHALHLLGASD